MDTKRLSPADAYQLAALPAQLGVALFEQAIIAAASSAIADPSSAALRTAKYHQGNDAGAADDTYDRLSKKAAALQLTLPERPQTEDAYASFAATIYDALQARVDGNDATALAALEAGRAAAELQIAMWSGHVLALLRTAAPSDATLKARAEKLRSDQHAASERLISALRKSGRPAVVAAQEQLAALLASTPDLVEVTTESGCQALHAHNLRIARAQTEVHTAFHVAIDSQPRGDLSAEEASLYSQILANPEDDALRLRFAELAEAHHDPRAELIRAQLTAHEIMRNPLHEYKAVPHTQRAKTLIQAHPEWRQEIVELGAKKLLFFRGFVGFVEIDAADFLRHAEALFQKAPIEHLQLHGVADKLESILSLPQLAQVRSLILKDNTLDDRAATAIAAATQLGRLRYLDLSRNKIGNAGIEALIASNNFPSLRYLRIDQNPGADPTDTKSYDDDTHYRYVPSKRGRELEAKYGPKPYLHPSADPWPPDLE